jgi:hypothetical protein
MEKKQKATKKDRKREVDSLELTSEDMGKTAKEVPTAAPEDVLREDLRYLLREFERKTGTVLKTVGMSRERKMSSEDGETISWVVVLDK